MYMSVLSIYKKAGKNRLFYDCFATRFLKSLLGLNDATRRAEIIAGAPVLGLRPMRCGLVSILKLPNPANLTSSP